MAQPYRRGSRVTRRLLAAVGLVLLLGAAGPALADAEKPYDFEEKPWTEAETALPDFPKQDDLLEFHAGPTERNRFFVDGRTIAVGSDGIVRYVLVLKTPGGASNVSLEGIRCDTREYKLFAVGLADGTWSKVQSPQWRTIENKLMNQYRATLNREFFCPGGAARNAAEIRTALRRDSRSSLP